MNPVVPVSDKPGLYTQINQQLAALLRGESDLTANTANAAALLYQLLPNINWVGFYFSKGDELVLGPFQGKPACSRISMGKGVCGTSAAKQQTVIVPDVSRFDGHIACDDASRSEIVVPLINWGKLVGVLDVDSPTPSRFDEDDAEGLEVIAAVLLSMLPTDHMPDLTEEPAVTA
ncbi:MAG: GAF domain-containing protein [Bryobacteraceae bacterium]